MLTANEIQDGLKKFWCTTQYHRHGLSLPYTDGVKYLIDNAEAYWLVDAISIQHKFNHDVFDDRRQGFTFWKLVKNEDDSCDLTCGDDEIGGKFVTFDTPGRPEPYSVQPVWEEIIPWTNFPLDEVILWYENGVIILPSEH
tara:strand:- start:3280 stop:3702 length:423 start_codon:yes stop_codon:yes gene_type:complete